METKKQNQLVNTTDLIKIVLSVIGKEREQEIIARRYGLYERKETLEQIGELLGITRERVRQLEKIVIVKLIESLKNNPIKEYVTFENRVTNYLEENGSCARILDITNLLYNSSDKIDQSRILFLTSLSKQLATIDTDEHYFASVALNKAYNSKSLKKALSDLVDSIKRIGSAKTADEYAKLLKLSSSVEFEALAKSSRQISTLNNLWGLSRWPIVNPKNIRDKIYIILNDAGKHMHFDEIAKLVKDSDFKRNNVTTQAIHNELIKDQRFILVGRGIYALKEWGYEAGTVSDVIKKVLKEANKPLHREEIVKKVLKNRYVKETTILLNLQGKKDFKRVSKGTYYLADPE